MNTSEKNQQNLFGLKTYKVEEKSVTMPDMKKNNNDFRMSEAAASPRVSRLASAHRNDNVHMTMTMVTR